MYRKKARTYGAIFGVSADAALRRKWVSRGSAVGQAWVSRGSAVGQATQNARAMAGAGVL